MAEPDPCRPRHVIFPLPPWVCFTPHLYNTLPCCAPSFLPSSDAAGLPCRGADLVAGLASLVGCYHVSMSVDCTTPVLSLAHYLGLGLRVNCWVALEGVERLSLQASKHPHRLRGACMRAASRSTGIGTTRCIWPWRKLAGFTEAACCGHHQPRAPAHRVSA